MTLPRPPESFDNIAVIRLSSVGDVVMALPAVEGLRRTYPRARITWIVESRARNLLEGLPAVDELIDFPRTAWRKTWKKPLGIPRSIPGIASFYADLRRRRFDLTIDFQGNLKSATCTVGAWAKVRVGYTRDECREPNHPFTNRRLGLGGQAVHRIDRDLLLAGTVGVPFGFVRPRIAWSAEDRMAGEATIPGPGQGRKTVVLHPGTSDFMPHKRWPLEAYAAVGDRLAREAGARVLVSWGPGEESTAARLAGLMREPAEPIPRTPTMKSLGALLSRADLVIGGDTGPVHLAVVLGVDAITLVGPGDPRHYYPYGHPERVFYRRVACSPCRHRSCTQRDCMTGIPWEPVAAEALRILARNR